LSNSGEADRLKPCGSSKSYSDMIIRVARRWRENAHRFVIREETAGSGILVAFVCF
jgi:hypothetical protein